MTPPVLDCQGLACPQPVLQCKQCVDTQAPAVLEVVVDNEAARENVTRYLGTRGYAVAVQAEGGAWRLTAQREGEAGADAPCGCEVLSGAQLTALEQKVCVFLPSEFVGAGDDTLGAKLMAAFLGTLPELGGELWRLVLVNGAVKMTVPGHPCFEKLAALAEAGVSILVCGTCLDFFGLLERKAVGQTTNMLDVVTSLQLASKVIRV
ncbi:sulfurtransferase-like selenium metabolism protein YedF [Desulfocurvus vexinensis]|uniref:sulfurtransferase-like selenium metabolism protein YedF n=1 Tax=Desulfocurvus vexinensis TaxID=399548 RepID=UPI00048DF6E2|nr:sulfurtransferase-like selenium metabolism protein YedF [Desulfocurvus vexinensis]